jgi:uncharacterized membrane protein YhdT
MMKTQKRKLNNSFDGVWAISLHVVLLAVWLVASGFSQAADEQCLPGVFY